MSEFLIEWISAGRKASMPANPDFPTGLDVDMAKGAEQTCTVALPYPAQNCGVHVVICGRCKLRIAITAAGRKDDPRTVKLPCRALDRPADVVPTGDPAGFPAGTMEA